MESTNKPSLFGQKHSSRDYSRANSWGKNQFNSSFPASLVAYMYSKEIKPVYIKTNKKNEIIRTYISSTDLYGIDALSDKIYYDFEAGFVPYEKFYQGKREHIDLVIRNNDNREVLSGLEVKLTALPDNTTKSQPESKWGAEIVMRSPTICFLACSICENYQTKAGKERLRSMLKAPKIDNWGKAEEVIPYYSDILSSILAVSTDMFRKQKPLIIQPIWKTEGNNMRLQENCLDVFVWSNLAVIQMCCTEDAVNLKNLNRYHRTIIWIYKMLLEYVTYNTFDYKRIIDFQSYSIKNDKAFSLPGTKSSVFLSGSETLKPRIAKCEIKNIILGGGQDLLSPERRFDAVLVNSPDIFE